MFVSISALILKPSRRKQLNLGVEFLVHSAGRLYDFASSPTTVFKNHQFPTVCQMETAIRRANYSRVILNKVCNVINPKISHPEL